MCGRFTLRTPAKTLATLFDKLPLPPLKPRYNIAPTQNVLCIRQSADETNEAVFLRWGLVPSWSADLKIGARMINARGETVATKPSFRAAFKKRRCLIVADGFYEWKKVGSAKQPYYITRADDQPFTMAGLWESWIDKNADGDSASTPIETCTIITTFANPMMAKLHDRMPVIFSWPVDSVGLADSDLSAARWLDNEIKDQQVLESLLVPCPAKLLQARPVSTRVNKATYDAEDCIQTENG